MSLANSQSNSPYPPGFTDWPQADRDKYYAEEAAKYRLKNSEQSRCGKIEPRADFAEFEPGPDPEIDWSEPKPLPDGLLPVAPFQMDFLPASIAPWVADITERMQCPPDFVGITAIVSLGSVIGRKICIKPQRRTDWFEVPNIWGLIIGSPGAMKSPAMSEALKPLQRLEMAARKEHEQALKSFATDAEVFALQKKDAQKRAERNIVNAKSIISALEPPAAPVAKRYILNDATYEKIGEILADNPNGILVFRDELVSLLRTLDREEYAAARGFYLTAWNGKDGYTFDRIIRGKTHIEAACISMLGSTQPGRIAVYLHRTANESSSDDGLIQRFGLLVWPDQSFEWNEIDRYPDIQAKDKAYKAFELLSNLTPESVGATQGEFGGLPYLRFTEAAQIHFSQWRRDFEKRQRSGELSPSLETHFAKYRKLIPSLALINHLADGGSGPVTEEAILRALALAEYLESHARRVSVQNWISSPFRIGAPVTASRPLNFAVMRLIMFSPQLLPLSLYWQI